MTHDTRPVFLNLLRIHLPITGVLSILHRVTGVLLLLLAPLLIYLLDYSLRSPAHFERLQGLLANPALRAVSLFGVWALVHHLLSGLRTMLIDAELGVGLAAARGSAWLVIGIGVVVLVLGAVVLA